MKYSRVLPLVSFWIFTGVFAAAQHSVWKPFTMLVMQPDTAMIAPALYPDADSVVARIFRTAPKPVDTARIKKFRYYHVISNYTTGAFHYYFNEYPPYSTIREIPAQQHDLSSLQHLADSAQADYILYYTHIHRANEDDIPALVVTTDLYARETRSVLLDTVTIGDGNSYGDMWTCSMDNRLSCPLINAVRTSTDAVMTVMIPRQMKEKSRKELQEP